MPALDSLDSDEVERFARTFEDLFYQSDAAGMASYYTVDARLMGENIEPLQGRDAVEMFWQKTCERAKSMRMHRTIRIEDIKPGDTLAYVVSTLTLDFTTPDGQEVHKTTKDITIWRKQQDGGWLIEVDISNPNPTN